MLQFVLAAMLFVSPYEQGKQMTMDKNYEHSISMLRFVQPTQEQYSEYCFLMAVNYFSLNNKSEAEKWIQNLKNTFSPTARRHEALVDLMERDIAKWKAGNLEDIVRDMKLSSARLETGRAGSKTQKVQDDIVAKLDKLIKEKENPKGGGKGEGDSDQPGDKSNGNGKGKPRTPQADSQLGGEGGPGQVTEAKLRNLRDNWGSLPKAERARAIQDITREVPDKFRPMIEEYFKSLNKMHSIP